MAFAIELYFDDVTESKIRSVWSELLVATLPVWPLRIGARPHASILVVDSGSSDDINTILRSIVHVSPFQLVFGLADHFDDVGLIFLKPDRSEELRDLRRRASTEARSKGLIPRHDGDEWVPHCTCDYGLTQEQMSVGLSILKRGLPLPARVEEAGSVEVTPRSVRPITTVTLGAHGNEARVSGDVE
jgi:hypothetical protein